MFFKEFAEFSIIRCVGESGRNVIGKSKLRS